MRYTNQEYQIIHRCGRCGKKAVFVSTRRFRVNANKNKLDVWLIYQCKKCKHTLNASDAAFLKSRQFVINGM